MDDKQRIALVETRTLDTAGDDQAPRNSSATSSATTSARPASSWTTQAQIISYEEYSPYGSTSYQAVRSQTETPAALLATPERSGTRRAVELSRGAVLRAVAWQMDELRPERIG